MRTWRKHWSPTRTIASRGAALRNVDHKILKQHVAKINGILKFIPTKDITDMNNSLLAAGRVVQIKVGMKRNEKRKAKELFWKENFCLR